MKKKKRPSRFPKTEKLELKKHQQATRYFLSEDCSRHTIDLIGDAGFLHAGNELYHYLAFKLGVDPIAVQGAFAEYFQGDMEIIPVEPIPSPRPRASSFNGVARVYHPAEYTYYKNIITNHILRQTHLLQEQYYSIAAICYLPFPKSEPKMRTYQDRPHSKKPDFDNLVKGFVDAITESGLIGDDGSLHTNLILKRYTTNESGYVAFKLISYP